MSANRVILSLVMALVLLAACGKRGPLYHPGQKSPEQQPEQQEQNLPPPTAPGY
ncbi:MAG: LPS translocon maturation chaperone LptM [Nevskiales bacterium]